MENSLLLDVQSTTATKVSQRVAAVQALFRGTPVSQVTAQYGICRSDLYKFSQRALSAMAQALQDQPRGPVHSANGVPAEQAKSVRALCERYPTWSSYRIGRRLGDASPNPRTIQRLRKRWGLPRVAQREPPRSHAIRLAKNDRQRVRQAILKAPYLGARRLSWDLSNREHLSIGHATITRLKQAIHAANHPPASRPVWRFYERHHPHSLWHGDFMEKVVLSDTGKRAFQFTLLDDYSRAYVSCDLFLSQTLSVTLRAIMAAMRQFQVIPKALLFDNGSHFKGTMLDRFCDRLGIEIIYTRVRHPQTNGKLERAFRDDMRDFYQQYKTWTLDRLRKDLPGYIYYRNHIRGHQALNGQPSITRLREQHRMALPWILERLEDYATYAVGQQVLPARGYLRLLGRNAYFDTRFSGLEVTLYETLNGLEMRHEDQPLALLRDYQAWRQMAYRYRYDEALPEALFFTSYGEPRGVVPAPGLQGLTPDRGDRLHAPERSNVTHTLHPASGASS